MKKINKQNDLSVSLEDVCRRFIKTECSAERIAVRDAALLLLEFGGYGTALEPPGFVVFLKLLGTRQPTLVALNAENIAAYWEYVAQYFGLLRASRSMLALKKLWLWCVQNQLIPNQPIPADLTGNDVKHPYRVTVKIGRPL